MSGGSVSFHLRMFLHNILVFFLSKAQYLLPAVASSIWDLTPPVPSIFIIGIYPIISHRSASPPNFYLQIKQYLKCILVIISMVVFPQEGATTSFHVVYKRRKK